jgi:hypothetical protein
MVIMEGEYPRVVGSRAMVSKDIDSVRRYQIIVSRASADINRVGASISGDVLARYHPDVGSDWPCMMTMDEECQGHSAPRRLQRGLSYPRTSMSPEWVVLVKLYAMKTLWLYRYEHRGGP